MTYNPTAIAGCKLWLKADAITGLGNGDPVDNWPDSSGNGHDATQTGDARPVYLENALGGLPAVGFTAGQQDHMVLPNLASAVPTAATLFIVLLMTSDACAFTNRQYLGDGDVDIYRWSNDGRGYWGMFRTARINGYPASVTHGTNQVISLVSSASAYQAYIDGTSMGAQTGSYNPGGVWRVGSADGLFYWAGNIYEIIVYDSALSDADRQKVEGYLAWKWGLEDNLPAGHLYKEAPPAGAPVIDSVAPDHGPVGSSVVITGLGFGSIQGESRVTFDGLEASIASWSDAQITCYVPLGAGSGNVVVTTLDGASNALLFDVVPTLASISPESGWVGDKVTLTGQGFGSARGDSYVSFGGVPATTYLYWTATQITCRIPPGALSGTVTVVVV